MANGIEMQQVIRIAFLAFLLVWQGCAQMVAPTGGEKDLLPPRFDTLRTFPSNRSVNFTGNRILFVFDEYVRVNNPSQQILISPAIDPKPTFVAKGKELRMEWTGTLKANTTYTISFGNSVVDLAEGNVAGDLQYVFSTGSELDSGQIRGRIRDAYSLAPQKGVWVMLYPADQDSVLLARKPEYIAVTDEKGNYRISHIREGSYTLVALRDGNGNYLFDQPSEEAAFWDEPITVEGGPAAASSYALYLFKEDREKQYVKKSQFDLPGRLMLVMNRPIETPQVSWNPSLGFTDTSGHEKPFYEEISEGKDTLYYWIQPSGPGEAYVAVADTANRYTDTVRVYWDARKAEKQEKQALKINHNVRSDFGLTQKLLLRFDNPLLHTDTSRIRFYRDSLPLTVAWAEKNSLSLALEYDFLEYPRVGYMLHIEPGAFTDIYGQKNDTLRLAFMSRKEEYYGVLKFAVKDASDRPYFLQLLDAQGRMLRELRGAGTASWTLTHMDPGNYKLRLVYDENGNGRWDTGDFRERRQPEKVLYFDEPITIRSNWDVELEWHIE